MLDSQLRAGRAGSGCARGSVTPRAVQRFSLLWLQLRGLLHELGSAWGVAMLHWVAAVFAIQLLATFAFLSTLVTGPTRRSGSTLAITVVAVLTLAMVCSFGERAEREVFKS